jgi:hypothetical protein
LTEDPDASELGGTRRWQLQPFGSEGSRLGDVLGATRGTRWAAMRGSSCTTLLLARKDRIRASPDGAAVLSLVLIGPPDDCLEHRRERGTHTWAQDQAIA